MAVYAVSLAALLFLLRWLELRLTVFHRSFEIYIGLIALIFTALGIWLALKLSKPKTGNSERKDEHSDGQAEGFTPESSLISTLGISKRELEILELIAQGHTNEEIAAKIFVSLSTVKTHNQNLFRKLDVKRRTQAIEKAKRLKLIF